MRVAWFSLAHHDFPGKAVTAGPRVAVVADLVTTVVEHDLFAGAGCSQIWSLDGSCVTVCANVDEAVNRLRDAV